MPELPEVEIIKKGLDDKIVGKTVSDIEIKVPKMFQGKKDDVVGAKITSIERRAKMLIINLSNKNSLLIHLKLTGQLVFDYKAGDKSKRVAGGHPSKDWVADLPNQFTHVIFKFSDGSVLYFNDLRKFGYVKVYKTGEIDEQKVLRELGPEPFSKEFSVDYLMRIFAKRPRVKIKQVLMDQTVISGVGNIYSDEALFCARISPLRLAKDVEKTELIKLVSCVREILQKGLKYEGSSENTFVNVEGKQGEMQKHFQVYQQTGKPCPECGTKIERIKIGGRSSHFCSTCQK
ncbi:MAG: bifunctional DNA-formamidopyrimidine glycosylase/DNA-(apurinic or apyrimidinic site) lyase [Candidatus Berkelbacteria bacterium]|nr:bifunctional DNA-formamidopyrimidine glycosylase/DNA-(apurinic or apyrimidinic site) lyase [Candidatus Berkelbacteria bacterium]